MRVTSQRLACFLVVTAVAMCLPTNASAGLINMLVGNFDIAFDGATGQITDFGNAAGGNQNTSEARKVSSFEIEVGGSSPVMLMSPPDNLWADLKISNLGSELTTGALVMGAGGTGDPNAFGFDFFTSALGGIDLQIGIDDISYSLITTGIPGLNFFNFFAEGVVQQATLPAVIPALDPNVLLSYTATEVMVLQGQNGARTVVASGQMTITGNMAVPEPAGLGLAGLACVGLVTRRRR
ncbi:MAG: PEP-CTERM sorting domain-containing protein [Planctomycetales bacterium]|nr:PEP-CTERM sorting domain-containing protein [Planctomycetales bacterium]